MGTIKIYQMKRLKLIAGLLIAGASCAAAVVFSPDNETAEGRRMFFETNDIKEVSRVKDLLSEKDMLKVQQLPVQGFLIKLRLTVKGKKEGTDIEIEGGTL
jgi:hypothetical protein